MTPEATPALVLDRVEGERAVLFVGEERVEIPAACLPPGAREGDVLRMVADEAATLARRDDAGQRLERLRKRSPAGGGPIDL